MRAGYVKGFQGACLASENAFFCSCVVREQDFGELGRAAETPVLPCSQTSRIFTNGSFKRLPAHANSMESGCLRPGRGLLEEDGPTDLVGLDAGQGVVTVDGREVASAVAMALLSTLTTTTTVSSPSP